MKNYLSMLCAMLAGITLMMNACKKVTIEADVSSCLERKIRDIKKEENRTLPIEVWQWKVDGENYYYISAECCDMYNMLYDDNCNAVCAPDGGLSGQGDGNCPEFKGPIEKTLIWKEEEN